MSKTFGMIGGGGGGIKLASISITTPPAKTTYTAGETFDPAGMVVEATYSNGAKLTATGYAVEPSGPLSDGMTSVTIRYTEGGRSVTTTQAVTVSRAVISTVPSQSGSLTYTGSSLSPNWNNYNSAQLTLGGTTSATNAGAYTATFTPTSSYEWSDGTTTAKSVSWTIGKAAGSLSIFPTSLTLDPSNPTGKITVTRAGNGTITAESSDTSVATVSVNGTEVTVSSVNGTTGSATITIKVAADNNYTAPSNKTCSVTAKFKATAKTSATSGVSYTDGISGLDPSTLTLFAEAISNNSAITNTTSSVYIDFGSINRKISVGDTIIWSVRGVNYVFVVMGFNHDDLATATAYGAATATGKAGISFQMQDCLAANYSMNSSNTNSGGWGSCELRTTLQRNIKELLPSAVQSAIKVVTKKASAGSKSTTINSYNDTLFLLSEVEVFGSTKFSASGEGTQYAYYKAGNSKIKNVSGSATTWWERSPSVDFLTSFCFVNSSGNDVSGSASNLAGVAFGFCF